MKNSKKSKDELDILLETMKAENSMPDKAFEEDLKYEILGKTGRKPSKNIFNLKFSLAFAASAILLLVVGVYGFQTYNMLFVNPVNDTTTKKVLSKEKQVEVLNNFVENNPEVVIASQTNSIAPTGSNVQSDTLIADQPSLSEKKEIILSSKSEATFTRTIGKLTLGENGDLCSPLVSDGVFTSEQIQYVDPKTGAYYYKDMKMVEENLESYYLLNADSYITYHGGKYAVVENVAPAPEDVEEETEEGATVEKTTDYFPEDTEVNEQEETYQIESSFKANCGTEEAEDWKTIIYVYTINNSDYSIQSSAYYLDEIKEENLISVLTYETTEESHTEDELTQLFAFEYDVELRDIAEFTNTYQERHDMLMEELTASKPKLLTVNEDASSFHHLTYSDLDAHYNLFRYMYNRDFYAANEFGQKIYDRLIEETTKEDIDTLYSYSFFDDVTSVQFDVLYFNPEQSNEVILDYLIHELPEGEERTIKVNEEELTATVYEVDSYHFVVFEFGGYKVVVRYYQFEQDVQVNLNDLRFGVWDLSNDEDIQKVDGLLREHFKGVENEIFGLGGC